MERAVSEQAPERIWIDTKRWAVTDMRSPGTEYVRADPKAVLTRAWKMLMLLGHEAVAREVECIATQEGAGE
jgi:hypothetical protein